METSKLKEIFQSVNEELFGGKVPSETLLLHHESLFAKVDFDAVANKAIYHIPLVMKNKTGELGHTIFHCMIEHYSLKTGESLNEVLVKIQKLRKEEKPIFNWKGKE